ncbi:hypothetical protein Tsubulata_012075 [Turnera subulata]|uniref:Uncharacterized protein n=1 Tax=Turnera subulata TaxID=218843 RepID=A0A9Q0F2K5_9ROSI|nr:hypothetical protein Tsubulata_012075 [Turnera subulata]
MSKYNDYQGSSKELSQYQQPQKATSGYCGVITVEPSYGSYQNTGTASYQNTSRDVIVDKRTGAYQRTTMKESYSAGETFKERGSGRDGYKDEYKTTSTTRVGDKSGYYEYQCEERYRRVNFDYYGSGSGSGKKSGGENQYGSASGYGYQGGRDQAHQKNDIYDREYDYQGESDEDQYDYRGGESDEDLDYYY